MALRRISAFTLRVAIRFSRSSFDSLAGCFGELGVAPIDILRQKGPWVPRLLPGGPLVTL